MTKFRNIKSFNDCNKFMVFAGSSFKRVSNVHRAQLRIIYILLFTTSIPLKDILFISYFQLLIGLKTGQIPVYNRKKKEFNFYIFPSVNTLHSVPKEIRYLFLTKGFLFLGSSKGGISDKIYSIYRLKNVIAKDMSSTAKRYNVKGCFGAQSFINGYEAKIWTICNVDEADIIMNKGSMREHYFNKLSPFDIRSLFAKEYLKRSGL